MFFSFSLFPPGISARCSRSALPPGFPPGISLRRGLARGAFPRSACLWGLVRFCRRFCLAALLRVSARISARCSRSAFPPGFPPGISLRAGLGSRSVSALRLPLRGLSVSACLFSACGYFRIRQKTRLPEPGRWLAALRRPPPGPFFRTGRRLRQRRNPRRTGCKVTYNSLIIAAFTIYSQFLQQRLRSP